MQTLSLICSSCTLLLRSLLGTELNLLYDELRSAQLFTDFSTSHTQRNKQTIQTAQELLVVLNARSLTFFLYSRGSQSILPRWIVRGI